jgi:hypothetical protein
MSIYQLFVSASMIPMAKTHVLEIDRGYEPETVLMRVDYCSQVDLARTDLLL